MPAFEVLLPLGAIGLYLFDSTLLLYSNELMFVRRGSRWSIAGSSALLLAGRRIYVPNPLSPGTPQFRVLWSEADSRQEQEEAAELERFFTALRPVQFLVIALLIIMLALPLELLVFGTGVELLLVMAAFYTLTLATLGYIFARRRELRVSGRAFAALCFDSLACAPFAINLARKLALGRPVVGNPIAFAARTFEPAVFSSLIRAVDTRLSAEQMRESGQTPRWSELESYRRRLAALAPPAAHDCSPDAK